ncbi:dihydroxyacetone kinase subunit DhaK [Oscillospiraceae bacterium 50-58]
MKKIINRPEDIVPEMCHGLILASPGLKWNSHYKVVSRASLNPDKVTLISGGGSGHEPAHAGFVGPGMLDAAVCGDVFASPSQIQVYQALRQTRGNKGALLIIKNYSGDMMNFKNAAFLAQEDGILVDYVKVDDDIAVQDSLYTVGRRGVAGTIFVHKIAGAAAERGYALSRVKELAQRAADHVKTIGFAETSCTVPAKGTPTFQLGEEEIEYGVGIHGEPGRSREPLASADVLARRMTGQLLSELGLDREQKAEIALLINGLGATPAQELYVLNHSVRQILAEYPGIQVVCSLVGNYMTSIDMAGASVSILKLDSELKELLFDSCKTVAWTMDGPQSPVPYVPLAGKEEPAAEVDDKIQTDPAWAVIHGDELTLSNLIYIVDAMSACIIRNEQAFCELDSFAGDGDFGMSVAKGFRQLKREWNSLTAQGVTLEQFLFQASMIIMEYCGGASGPIWGAGFRAAGRYCQGKDSLSKREFAGMLAAVVQGIQATGERSFGRGAQVGDKTLMDALIPCAQVWQEKAGTELTVLQLFQEGARASVEGAKSTEKIVARMGRAGTVGERSLGYPDAGAHALGVIFTELAGQLS